MIYKTILKNSVEVFESLQILNTFCNHFWKFGTKRFMRQHSCNPYGNCIFFNMPKQQTKTKSQAQEEGGKKGSSENKTIPLQILTNL